MRIAPLPGPEGLFTVSARPRFLFGSGTVGWQGAYFTDIQGAQEGVVDHGHERFCVYRGMHRGVRRQPGQGVWEDFGPGFSVLRAGDEQRFEWARGGRAQFLFVAPEQVQAVLGEGRTLKSLGRQQACRSPMLSLLFDALQADLAQGSPAGPLLGDSLIAAVLAQLADQDGPAQAAGTPRGMNRVLELIEARFAQALSLQELAQAAGTGVRQFSRAFRRHTGHTPHQYLLRRRVEHAQMLILQAMPLVDVALQCGFADQSQLTRAFVSIVGTTPGRYRRGLPG